MEASEEAMRYIAQLATNGLAVQFANPEGTPYAIVPGDYNVQSLEHLCPPKRVKQRVTFGEAASFIEYVNRFKNPDTMMFAAISHDVGGAGSMLTAFIDYHGQPGESGKARPDYCSHIAHLEFTATADWLAWMRVDRRNVPQQEFAEWLEDHLHFFNVETLPKEALKGAQLLELVTTLHATSAMRFNSLLRLSNGSRQLNYAEDNTAGGTVGGNKVVVPEMVFAAIQPFHGAKHYQVSARLKTRPENGKLMLRLETERLENIVRDAITKTVEEVGAKTEIKPLIAKI